MNDSLSRSASAVIAALMLLPHTVAANGLREFLDSIDLNDYSLGLNFYTSQSEYQGIDDFAVIFPVPTTFSDVVMTDDVFFIDGSRFGLRKVRDDRWIYGGLLDIQTKGFGSNESEVLAGMRRRGWTLQAGGMLGKRFGRMQVDVAAGFDILGKHNGYDATLNIAVPFERERFFVIPKLVLKHESADLVDYYYGVRDNEAIPGRPAYSPGAATTASGVVDWSWRFHRLWYLNVTAALDLLPREIRDSPLVDKETDWRFGVGLAYDRKAWVAPDAHDPQMLAGLDAGIGVFFVSSESNIDIRRVGTGASADLESRQGLEESAVMIPFDIVWRFGRYHRVDFSYFALSRDASTDIASALIVGDVSFPAGETIATSLETRVLRLGYGFSFFRDSQKELTLFGGLHTTDIEYRVRGTAESIAGSTTALLPVIGVHFRVTPVERISVHASLEMFQLDFDRHSGEMFDVSLGGQYRLTKRLSVGAGYRFYRQDIDSGDDSLFGDFRFDYRGPTVFLRTRF